MRSRSPRGRGGGVGGFVSQRASDLDRHRCADHCTPNLPLSSLYDTLIPRELADVVGDTKADSERKHASSYGSSYGNVCTSDGGAAQPVGVD
jgi:hypothetical protein